MNEWVVRGACVLGGAVGLYAVARIASPFLERSIAIGVTERIAALQSDAIGGNVVDNNVVFNNVGQPIAREVLNKLYLR